MIRKILPLFRFSSGKLFTWNNTHPKPEKIKLPQNITKISCGPSHYAAVGQSGNLYTFGDNSYGQLGVGDNKQHKQFKLVQYFQKKNIKVKDALCGQKHTIVLTQQGQVYTFGWGGRDINILMKLFMNPVGPLGHGNTTTYSLPVLVKTLQKDKQNIDRISAGKYFNLALTQQGDVYQWGKGQYGVFGDGNNKNFTTPVVNEYFQYLKVEQLLKIKKMKSCQTFSVALMNDNKLYGWGSNQHGQMGIKLQIGIQIFETVNFATQIIRQGYQNQKVLNFDISCNTLLFQLDNKQLWWTGMKIAYKPQKLAFPQQITPKLFAAGDKSLVIVSQDNKIFSKNSFLKIEGSQQDIKTGFQKGDGSKIFGGNIIAIGGQHKTRYAIVQ